MIKKLRITEDPDVNFSLFSIISHEKSYKLCWRINKKLQINLSRVEPLTLLKSGSFHRYRHLSESEKIEVVSNRSLKGFLDTKDKKVNYFLKIEKPFFERQKTNLISKLNDVSEILLIFEVDLEKDTNKKELFYD